MGVLLETPRSASILAIDDEVIVIRFTKAQFDKMMQNLPFFGLVLSRTLASRLHAINRQVSLPRYSGSVDSIDDATLSLVPFEFRAHHQVLPIGVEQHHLTVGFVEEPPTSYSVGFSVCCLVWSFALFISNMNSSAPR